MTGGIVSILFALIVLPAAFLLWFHAIGTFFLLLKFIGQRILGHWKMQQKVSELGHDW